MSNSYSTTKNTYTYLKREIFFLRNGHLVKVYLFIYLLLFFFFFAYSSSATRDPLVYSTLYERILCAIIAVFNKLSSPGLCRYKCSSIRCSAYEIADREDGSRVCLLTTKTLSPGLLERTSQSSRVVIFTGDYNNLFVQCISVQHHFFLSKNRKRSSNKCIGNLKWR